MTWPLGVCSWSVRPASPDELVSAVRALGLSRVQLALDPIRTGAWDEDQTLRALDKAGVTIASGMMAMAGEDYSTLESIRLTGGVRPDATWSVNLEAAVDNADLAARLGVSLVTFHAGFIPHDPSDPERGAMLSRVGMLTEMFAEQGVRVALETGQETAGTLLDALREIEAPTLGVNFDPANMILYGVGDPIAAVRELAPRLAQVHIKDAVPASAAGEWGREVAVGEGAVDWTRFFSTLRAVGFRGELMIEREAGEDRVGDIRRAAALVGTLND